MDPEGYFNEERQMTADVIRYGGAVPRELLGQRPPPPPAIPPSIAPLGVVSLGENYVQSGAICGSHGGISGSVSLDRPPALPYYMALIQKQLDAIVTLMGMGDEEKRFFQYLAHNPTDKGFMGVFADWLEERGREEEAKRFREMSQK